MATPSRECTGEAFEGERRSSGEVLRCDLLRDFAELESLSGEWERLWAQHPARTIFNSFTWVKHCWEVAGTGREICTPVVYEGARIVSILPLALQGKTLDFIGHGHSDYNDILAEPGREADAVAISLRHLLRSEPRWSTCVLANVPERSLLLLAAAAPPRDIGARLVTTAAATCPSLRIDDDGAELEGILKKNKLKYYQRRLEKLGQLGFRHLEDRDEIAAHMESFFHEYRGRRAAAGDLDSRRHERLYKLLASLGRDLDPRGELRFSVLELDGRPIAYHFGFELDGRLIYYKPTFNIHYWDYSPGQVLLKKILEYARGRGLREVDFTVGDEDYKTRFTNQSHLNYNIRLYRSTITCGARRAFELAKGRILKNVRVASAGRLFAGRAARGVGRAQAVLQTRGLLPTISGTMAHAMHACIYSRIEILVLSRVKDGHPSPEGRAAPPGLDLRMRPGRIDELAELAFSHPERVTTDRLRRVRERVKQGDRLYFGDVGGRVVHTAWIRTRDEIAIAEAGPDFKIGLEGPAAVIYDCWTPPEHRGRGIYTSVLRRLCELEGFGTEPIWIYCDRANRPSLRAIENAGFRRQYAVTYTRILGRFSRSTCVSLSGSPQPAPAGASRLPDRPDPGRIQRGDGPPVVSGTVDALGDPAQGGVTGRAERVAGRPLRVCYLITDLGVAGTELQLLALIRNLDRSQVQPYLCVLNGRDEISRAGVAVGCTVQLLGVSNLLSPRVLPQLRAFAHFLQSERIDILQMYFPESTYFGVLAGRLAGVPALVRTRNNVNHWMTPIHRWLGRRLNGLVSKTVCNSAAARRAVLADEWPDPASVIVIENGIDLESFAHIPPFEPAREGRGPRRVGMIANLRPIKGVDLFVRAAALISRQDPEVTFHVAGEGPQRHDLEELIDQLGLTGRVILHGSVADVVGFLSNLDVAVLSSRSEGMPNAVLEYMATGRPIVAATVGGVPELIEDGVHGILVPPEDPGRLAAEIARLLADTALAARLAGSARRRCEERHARRLMTRRFERFYHELYRAGNPLVAPAQPRPAPAGQRAT